MQPSLIDQPGPVGLNLKVKSSETLVHAVDRLLEAGSTVTEFPYRLSWNGESKRLSQLSGVDTRLLLEQVARFDRVSLHGPIGNTFLTNPEVNAVVIESLRTAISEAALIGAGVIALHIEPTFPNLEFGPSQLKASAAVLRDLAELASCYGVLLGLETEYPYTLRDFVGLIDEVDHPSFGATLDVGHLYDRRVPYHTYIDRELLRSSEGPAAYNALLAELTKELLEREKLFHVHIHQHRREALGDPWPYGSCDHWTLDDGFIDIPAFFRMVAGGGYQGIVICEIARGKAGPKAHTVTFEEEAHSLELAKTWWREAISYSREGDQRGSAAD